MYPELIFGGIEPSNYKQDYFTGINDVGLARAAIYTYYIDSGRNPIFEDGTYEYWELEVKEAAI